MAEATAKLARITKRPEYLAVARTQRKWVTPSFILQAKPSEGDSQPRAGFTTSKKVGNAVYRNKARRRLKEAARAIFAENAQVGWDYVLVGRHTAVSYPFEKLKSDMRWALAKLASGTDLEKNRNKKPR